MTQIILASTSPFRAQLLKQTGLQFSSEAPEVDETPFADETPEALVERLAIAKAQAIARRHTGEDYAVIGSDQVCVVRGEILSKPGDHTNAVRQLTAAAGQTVTFYTGLAVVASATGKITSSVELFEVVFRDLTAAEIENYLQREQPYQCAGSFKSEALGITLFSALRGDDPNTLIGLPLIRLLAMLREQGINPLAG